LNFSDDIQKDQNLLDEFLEECDESFERMKEAKKEDKNLNVVSDIALQQHNDVPFHPRPEDSESESSSSESSSSTEDFGPSSSSAPSSDDEDDIIEIQYDDDADFQSAPEAPTPIAISTLEQFMETGVASTDWNTVDKDGML
jgi:hypothetical protein